MFFFTDESSLVDSRSRKWVRFTDAELGSDVLKSAMPFFTSISLDLNLNLCILKASTSKDPLASNTLLQPSGFLPQVTPISSHQPALSTRKCFLLGFAGCNVSRAIPVVRWEVYYNSMFHKVS